MTRGENKVVPRLLLDRVSAAAADPSTPPLADISLSLGAGRCLAVLGGRRHGGSLLVDVIAGHASSRGGLIAIDGKSVDRMPPMARGFGTVSARDPLFPHLDVAANVAFPLRVRRLSRAERSRRVDETLALLGLDAVARQRPHMLDPDTATRTALARALVADPPLLLLDQPFTALDPEPRQLLHRALRRLVRARGVTMLLCTADRDEALLLGDEVGILDQGRLHQVASASILLDRPADAVVAERLGDANLLFGQVVRVDDEAVRVRLGCGYEMDGEAADVMLEGMACVMSVRPDRIATALVRQSTGLDVQTGSLPAVLTDAIHLGDHLRLRFRLADGSELLVRRPPAAAMSDLRPDRPALLAWQPHQARVFPAAP